jgi:hypothetical protein
MDINQVTGDITSWRVENIHMPTFILRLECALHSKRSDMSIVRHDGLAMALAKQQF